MGLEGRMTRSSLGPQTLSTKETAASFGFGSSDRATWSKVFSTKEHAKADYGKTSPGPVYDAKSSLGVQFTSEKGTLPLFSFGTADRFARSTARSKSAMVPGPGAYQAASALGEQQVSHGIIGWGMCRCDAPGGRWAMVALLNAVEGGGNNSERHIGDN